MPDSIKISVIIPTFNRAILVKRAIRSVLNQSFQPYEIIVIDDGSTDGTSEFIKTEFPQIKYFWQKNSGVSVARNLGIQKSKGNWLAFLDSDDEWLPKKLEMQTNALHENPEYKICHTNEIWIRNEKRVNPKDKHQKSGGFIFEKCLPLCVISPSSVLIKKEIFKEFGLFNTTLPACEDYDMWLRICAFLLVLYLEELLLKKYGGHDDQLSQKYWGMDRFRIIALEKVLSNKTIGRKNRNAALEMLLKKLKIFINGAYKRKKNPSEIKEFIDNIQNKLKKFCSLSCSRRSSKRNSKHKRKTRIKECYVEPVSKFELFKRYGGKCAICGRKLNLDRLVPHPLAVTIDHIIPISMGGEHSYKNTQLACFKCNYSKGDGLTTNGEQLKMFG